MSTRFEFYLSEFIEYCIDSGFGRTNKMFDDEFSVEYNHMYDESIYHGRIERFFNGY